MVRMVRITRPGNLLHNEVWKITIEIVTFPMKNVESFHSYASLPGRVTQYNNGWG